MAENNSERYFCRFTFSQFFALLLMEAFALVLVFYLGARYGPELFSIPPEAVEGSKVEQDETVVVDSEIERMANEVIKTAQKPTLKEQVQRLLELEKKKAQEEEEKRLQLEEEKKKRLAWKKKPIGEEELFKSEKVELFSNKEEVKPPKEADTATDEAFPIRIKTSESAKYSIQVGSYPRLEEASKMVGLWKTKGYNAFMMIADIPDRGRWYRVRIGGFATKEEAKRYLEEFISKEGVEAIVVLNEQ